MSACRAIYCSPPAAINKANRTHHRVCIGLSSRFLYNILHAAGCFILQVLVIGDGERSSNKQSAATPAKPSMEIEVELTFISTEVHVPFGLKLAFIWTQRSFSFAHEGKRGR